MRENGGLRHIHRPDDLIDILRRCGYTVNLSGKNHSYLSESDFDFYSVYNHAGGGRAEIKTNEEAAADEWLRRLVATKVSDAPAPFPVECHPTSRIVKDAIECVDSQGDKPFFLWLSFPDPHPPYEAPEPYYNLFPEDVVPERTTTAEDGQRKGWKWRWLARTLEHKNPGYDTQYRKYRSVYCGMIRLIDDQIRRFVGHLEKRVIMDDTLIIFTADHGDFAGEYGQIRKGLDLPECLIRIPLILCGPGITAGSDSVFVSLTDIMPTVCEVLNQEVPYGVQGRSLLPILAGGKAGEDFPEEEFRSIYSEVGFGGMYYDDDDDPPVHVSMDSPHYDTLNCVTQSGNMKMVRMGQWKLVFDILGMGQLYDLSSDPFEVQDLFDEPTTAEVRSALMQELLKWTIRTEDDLPQSFYKPRRFDRNWHSKQGG